MSKDAKLGLVVGLGLVLTIGIVFFRKDSASASGTGRPSTTQQTPESARPAEPSSLPPVAEPPPM